MRFFFITLIFAVNMGNLQSSDPVDDTIKIGDIEGFVEIYPGYLSPVEIYFFNKGSELPFVSDRTGNPRGHVADWVVIEDRLFLVGLNTYGPQKEPLYDIKGRVIGEIPSLLPKEKEDLHDYFDNVDSDGRVWATWFSGLLLVKAPPKIKVYIQGMQRARYSKYIYLDISSGRVIDTIVQTWESESKETEIWRRYDKSRIRKVFSSEK